VIDLMLTICRSCWQATGRRTGRSGRENRVEHPEAEIVQRDPDWRTELLAVITNPPSLPAAAGGHLRPVLEFMNPDSLSRECSAASHCCWRCLRCKMLPVNYVGLALIRLGVALLVTNFSRVHPACWAAGCWHRGRLRHPDRYRCVKLRHPLPMVGAVALVGAAGLLIVGRLAYVARRRPIVSGREYLSVLPGDARSRG